MVCVDRKNKSMKKILTYILCISIILSFSTPIFAEENDIVMLHDISSIERAADEVLVDDNAGIISAEIETTLEFGKDTESADTVSMTESISENTGDNTEIEYQDDSATNIEPVDAEKNDNSTVITDENSVSSMEETISEDRNVSESNIGTEEIEEAEPEEELEQASIPSVSYRTHVQSIGWQSFVKDGVMSGTQGKSKRLEGIEINVTGADNLGIQYKTHIQTYGWETDWKANGAMSGTSGQSKRLEAIRIELTGADAAKYDIWYCVHAQHFGWLGWAKNGADAGTAGYAYRLEGIKIKILPKNSTVPANEGNTSSAFYSKKDGPSINTNTSGVAYNTHVQTYGWQDYVYNGGMSGTFGQSKRLEGIHISLVNQQYSGNIEYRTHVQTYGWQDWKTNGAMSGTSGEAKRLEAIQIRLTGEMAKHYDVYYRVHAQSYGWLAWASNGNMSGTSGYGKRLEGIQIVLIKKGGIAPSSDYNGIKQNNNEPYIKNPIPANSPQPQKIKITKENWKTYFTIERSFSHSIDAYGNIVREALQILLLLKPEYNEGFGSLKGTIGYEYKNVPHYISNINKSDGALDVEIKNSGPIEKFHKVHNIQNDPNEIVSTTKDLNSYLFLATADCIFGFEPDYSSYSEGAGIHIKDAEKYGEQWLYYPEEINIIRVDGELTIYR